MISNNISKMIRNQKIQKYICCLSFLFLAHCQNLIQVPPPSLMRPVKNARISQKFSPLWNLSHQGIDFSASTGTPVYSSHSGTVVYAGNRLSGYGNVIIIEFSPYWSTLYAHLNSIKVKEFQKIRRGTVIGTVGTTGRSTAPHLHFELMHQKHPINPLPYLQ